MLLEGESIGSTKYARGGVGSSGLRIIKKGGLN